MKTFKLFSMAALALVMAACSNEDNAIEQRSAQTRNTIPFSATINAIGGGTRTIITEGEDDYEGYLMVAWKGGEEIALVHNGKRDVVTVTTVNADGSAVISGNIDATGTDGEDVKLVYPAGAVKSVTSGTTYVANTDDDFLAPGFAQDGTLAYIGNNHLDGRQGNGKLTISGGKATLKSNVNMESKTAIFKFTLTTDGETQIAAKTVTLKLGGTPIAAGQYADGKGSYYLSVIPATLDDLYAAAATAQQPTPAFTIDAYDGTYYYTYTKSGKLSLSTGTYYQSLMSMSPSGVICTDRSIYSTASAARTALKIPVGKIVYVGSNTGDNNNTNGLALSLIDVGFETAKTFADDDCTKLNSNTSTAYEAFNGTNNTAVSSGTWSATWMLPTKDQWDTMITAAHGFANLRDGFKSVGGENMRTSDPNTSDSYYWSSTKVPNSDTWWYSIHSLSGEWEDDSAHNCWVRACFAF